MKLGAAIEGLLRPPEFDDLDKQLIARLLHALLLWLVAATLVVGPLIIYATGLQAETVFEALVFFLIQLLLLWLTHKGFARWVSIFLCLVVLALIHGSVLQNGGTDAPAVIAYSLVVVFAGLLIGGRGAIAAGTLCLASYGSIVYLQSMGRVAHTSPSPLTQALIQGVVIGMVVLCLGLARVYSIQSSKLIRSREAASSKYRVLVENLPVVTHLAEPGEHGAWLYISPQVERMVGFSAQEWLSNPDLWVNQLHPADRSRILEEEAKFAAAPSGQVTQWEYRFICKDGNVVWLQDNAILIWDDALGKYLWHGTFVDITDRKEAEDATQRLAGELLLLDKVRSALAREVELPSLLHTVVESIAAFHGYNLVSLYLVEGDALVLQHQVGYEGVIEKIPIDKGVSGQVVRTGQPVLLEDVSLHEDFLGAIKGIVSEVCVPLFHEGEVAGTLNVESTDENRLTEKDLNLLLALGEHISVALARARAYSDLQRRGRIEFALQNSMLAILSEMELSDVLKAILNQATLLLDTAHGYIYLTTPVEDEIEVAMGTGAFEHYVGSRLKRGEGLAGKIWDSAAPLNVTDYHTWSGRASTYEGVPFHAVLGAPLISAGKPTGILGLGRLEVGQSFSEEDVELIRRFAQLASIAFENARLFNLSQQELRVRRAAEAALLESEKRYEGVLNNMIEGCRIIGFDWRYLYVNNAAAVQGHNTVDELMGRNMIELFPWIVDTAAFKDMQTCMEKRIPVYQESEFHYPDGSMNWYQYSIQPVPEGIFILSVDITEQKLSSINLQKVTDSLQTVLNSSPLAILGYDREARVRFWSPSAERVFGWKASEVVGQIANHVHQANFEEYQVLKDRVLGGEIILGLEARRYRKDSTSIDVSLNLAPTYDGDGRIDGYIALIEDISARKQRERELRALASVSAALRVASSQAEIMPIVLDQTMELFNTQAATLILHDRFTGVGRIEAARGLWEYSLGWNIPPGQGATGSVISSGRPYVTANVYEDSVVYFKDANENLPAFVSVPLSTSNGFIGTINVGRFDPFSPDEVSALESVADIAANAMQRTASHELAMRRVSQLQALHNIDIAITSSLDLRVTLDVLLDHTVAQLDVDAAEILKYSDMGNKLSYAAGRGFETPENELIAFERKTTFANRAANERRSIIISEIRQETMPPWFATFLSREKFVSYIGVPLVAKGTLVGVLEVFHRSPIQATLEWVEFLETLATQAALAMDNAELFTGLQQSNLSLALSYDATIEGWSRALDLRDKETEGHTQRVTEQTLRLARIMQFPEEQITHIRRGALLHDIGKMGVPDSILLKPAPLTDEEWLVMRRHPQYAYDLISPIRYLEPALEIPFCHHEKWDGSGYPRGLAGERIPLAARIFTVVDVWDALTSNRPYREAWSEEKALAYIRENAGIHFDPKVVEIFLRNHPGFS